MQHPRRGLALATFALVTLAVLLPRLPTPWVLALTLLTGAGLGTVMPPTQVVVQHAAGRNALGSATASIAIARSIGGAVGVALIGALLFAVAGREGAGFTASLNQALEGGAAFVAHLGAAERAALASHLDDAFRMVFATIALMTGLGAVLAATVPKPEF